MSKEHKRLFWPALVIALAALGAVVLVVANTRAKSSDGNRPRSSEKALNEAAAIQSQSARRHRNLSLQPEAFKLSRRLGQRFANSSRRVSVLAGTLTMRTEQQAISMVRRQTERGERVEIAVGGRPGLLTWSEAEGARSSGGVPTEAERNLIESLALDTADQFVLAQLRGASYYTVASNVRPRDAGDNYTGPALEHCSCQRSRAG